MKQLEIEKGFNMDYPTRIDLCDGKYSVIYDFETGQSECLYYGEKWRELHGDKMVLAMFDRIAELEEERTQLINLLRESHKALYLVGCTPENSRRDSDEAEELQERILAAIGGV